MQHRIRIYFDLCGFNSLGFQQLLFREIKKTSVASLPWGWVTEVVVFFWLHFHSSRKTSADFTNTTTTGAPGTSDFCCSSSSHTVVACFRHTGPSLRASTTPEPRSWPDHCRARRSSQGSLFILSQSLGATLPHTVSLLTADWKNVYNVFIKYDGNKEHKKHKRSF